MNLKCITLELGRIINLSTKQQLSENNMSNIEQPRVKLAYVDLIAFLELNKNKKVNTILEEAKAMCASKGSSMAKTFLKNDEGETIAIYCYYFKAWMPLCDVEFGKKASTASGYNTMCKSGVSNWSKQQRTAKKANEELLAKLESGELQVSDLEAERAAIEADRKLIVDCNEIGFDTVEAVLAHCED